MTLKLESYNDVLVPYDAFKEFEEAQSWLEENANLGEAGFGWMNLPSADTEEIIETGSWLTNYDAIVQIGIGGSSLGNLMINEALLAPHYNELSREDRGGPRFYMVDNVDGRENEIIWNLIDPERTAFIVVSKSGQTLETMSNFLFFWDRLKSKLGDLAFSHVVGITDSVNGLLVRFCDETGCRKLSLPSDVGGRFSVLSCVGLLSSVALGLDIKALLKGAAQMKTVVTQSVSYRENPALLLSWNLFKQQMSNRPITVFMPYGDRLACLSEWFCQLWAESLGKNGRGPTPVRALGAVDQHSQLQLYTEGPDDKVYMILGIDEKKISKHVINGERERSLSALGYINGLSLDGILSNERRALVALLAGKGRPAFSLEFSSFDEKTLGGFIFLFEYVTAIVGYFLHVNPFDQPGVELGKFYTYGLCGRTGEEKYRDEVEHLEKLYRSGALNIKL